MNTAWRLLIASILFWSCESAKVEPNEKELPTTPEDLNALLVQEPSDVEKRMIYNKLYKLYRSDQPSLALEYLLHEQDISRTLDDNLNLGKASYNIGLIYKNQGQYIKAVDSYLEAVQSFDVLQDSARLASTLNNLGSVFYETGNFEYSERFFLKAKSIYGEDASNKKKLLALFNLGLCSMQKDNPDFNMAQAYFTEALKYSKKVQNTPYYRNRIYNQLGKLFHIKEDYQAAVDNYLLALNIEDPESNLIGLANVGEVYLDMSDYSKSEEYMEKALQYSKGADKSLLAGVLNIQARLYSKTDRYAESIVVLEKAIDLSDKDIINDELQESLKLLGIAYKNENAKHGSINSDSYEKLISLDSKQDELEKKLLSQTNFKALQAALGLSIELDNEIKAKQEEIAERERVSNIALGFGLISLVLAIGVLAYNHKYKKTKKRSDELEGVCVEVEDILESIPGVSKSSDASSVNVK